MSDHHDELVFPASTLKPEKAAKLIDSICPDQPNKARKKAIINLVNYLKKSAANAAQISTVSYAVSSLIARVADEQERGSLSEYYAELVAEPHEDFMQRYAEFNNRLHEQKMAAQPRTWATEA
jgi:hypothetical protein